MATIGFMFLMIITDCMAVCAGKLTEWNENCYEHRVIVGITMILCIVYDLNKMFKNSK